MKDLILIISFVSTLTANAGDVAIYHQKMPPVKYKGVECEQSQTQESSGHLSVSAHCYDSSFKPRRQCNFKWTDTENKATFFIATYNHTPKDMQKVSPQQTSVSRYSEQSNFAESGKADVRKLEEVAQVANEWMNKYCGDKIVKPSIRIYKEWNFKVNSDLQCEYKEISDNPGFIDSLDVTCYPKKDNLKTQCNFDEKTHVAQDGKISSKYSFDIAYYKTQGSKKYQDNDNEKQEASIPFSTRKQVMDLATKIMNEKCKSNPNYKIPVVKSKVDPAGTP